MSNETENQSSCQTVGITRLFDIGRSGLTWDWSKMEMNKEYLVSMDDIVNTDMPWLLPGIGITELAQKLNAEVIIREGVMQDGSLTPIWYILLRPLKTDLINPQNQNAT